MKSIRNYWYIFLGMLVALTGIEIVLINLLYFPNLIKHVLILNTITIVAYSIILFITRDVLKR